MKNIITQPNLFKGIFNYIDTVFSQPEEMPVRNASITIYYQSINLDELNVKNWEEELVVYIGKNYTNSNLSLTKVSKEIGKNEKSISKFLQKTYDLSFKQYLNNIRLEEAKRLIKMPELSLKEIAYMVGYGSSNHFTRVFKQYEGVPPSAFRNEKTMELV